LAEIVDQFRKDLSTPLIKINNQLFLNDFFYSKKKSQKIAHFLTNKQLLFWPKHCNPCCNNYYNFTTAVIFGRRSGGIGHFAISTMADRLQSVSGKDYESND